MMTYKRSLIGLVAVMGLMLFSHAAKANNIAVTNVVLYNTNPGAGTTEVKFDLSWENSWRASWTETGVTPNVAVTNWDAAWVFVKYRVAGGDWHHATLASTQLAAPAGTTIDLGATDGTNVGAFVYRSADGSGNLNLSDVKLRWNYATNGVLRTNEIDVAVHAIEMVYVAEGSYELGTTNGTETGHFHAGGDATSPYTVTNEDYSITVANTAGNLYYVDAGGNEGDNTGIVSNAFPKGYLGFYCMKYEISQGQYADFLNQLTLTAAQVRDYPSSADRHTITQSTQPYSASAPDRACNFLSWADGAAYADWTGLRPMTELEFEKACRGPLAGVANEYAWGNTTLDDIAAFTGVDGSGTETASVASDNANCKNNGILGPVRCGIFATASSTRITSGSTYWGIMEMSGNLWERPVTIGNATGRAFMGTHGDGELDGAGNASNPDWPGTGATGAGFRGGDWRNTSAELRASGRNFTASTNSLRNKSNGWRAVRSAP